ncbi:hypothetical protein ACWGK7_16055 [Sphingomonas aurantiaca]
MTEIIDNTVLPAAFVPTPTREFNAASVNRGAARPPSRPALELVRSTDDQAAAGPVITIPIPPLPISFASRVLIYKQDPSVAEIGLRRILLRGLFGTGPSNNRIHLAGVPPVAPNSMNDFIQTPDTPTFDAVHTFSVVHLTLAMCQRAVGAAIKWQWNSGSNTDPITVFPHAGVTMNAFYSRGEKALKFFYFNKPGAPAPAPVIYTCRSLDIVAHECGHAVLDSLKPGWLSASANPQTGALHEAFGDLVAVFLSLSQLDQAEALIVQTKGNLHNKNFLSDVAEQFGLALGRDNGLRNADNDKKLSQVTSEVHDLSQVFTGGVYDILADIFLLERNLGVAGEDEALTLVNCAQYVFRLLLRAIQAAPATNATFADVVNKMLAIAAADGKPVAYRNAIRNQFTAREVVVSPTPLTQDMASDDILEAVDHPFLRVKENGLQDRSGCCGTMRLREHQLDERYLEDQLRQLQGGIGGEEDPHEWPKAAE